MWTNARLSLGCVKEEIALILLGLLSANALLDTNLMKCHKNVKVRTSCFAATGNGGGKQDGINSKLTCRLHPRPVLVISMGYVKMQI